MNPKKELLWGLWVRTLQERWTRYYMSGMGWGRGCVRVLVVAGGGVRRRDLLLKMLPPTASSKPLRCRTRTGPDTSSGLQGLKKFDSVLSRLDYRPRGSIYTTIMEFGTERPSLLWFWGPNSTMVVYMDPLGE